MPVELVAGKTIAGRYKLDGILGRGGMGEVWSATQTVTRKRVALKLLKSEHSAHEEVRRRFIREARAACAVHHPNVVQIHDVLELEDGSPVLVMELLKGMSLGERLRGDGKMSLPDIAAVLARVVSAVGTAHALGIVHRDLKPDNIFLSETPEGVEVKVLDFGIAKLTASEGDAAQTGGLTNTGTMLGTPHYMSPEQAFGEKKIDHRADIWSLGIILYRALTGVLPTQADNIGQILKIIMMRRIPPITEHAPDLPPDVVELVGKMLEQDPSKRPESLEEVKVVLERHAGLVVDGFGAPASAPADPISDARFAAMESRADTPGTSPPSDLASRTSRRRSFLVVGIGALGAGGIVAFAALGRSSTEAEPPQDAQATATEQVSPSTTQATVETPPSLPPPPVLAAPTPVGPSATPPTAKPATPPPPAPGRPTVARPTAPAATAAPPSPPAPPPATQSGIVEKPPF